MTFGLLQRDLLSPKQPQYCTFPALQSYSLLERKVFSLPSRILLLGCYKLSKGGGEEVKELSGARG